MEYWLTPALYCNLQALKRQMQCEPQCADVKLFREIISRHEKNSQTLFRNDISLPYMVGYFRIRPAGQSKKKLRPEARFLPAVLERKYPMV